MNQYDLVIDMLPKVTPAEHAAALRVVNSQPDAHILRQMLGLEVPATIEKPEPVMKGWCEKHRMQKRVRPSGDVRCQGCQSDSDRRKRERRRMERDRGAQTGA